MKCAYHPSTLATIDCSSCGRRLCPACDHRIKGAPHCQDCIVTGINLLREAQSQGRNPIPRDDKSPWIALLFSIIPGLGAAYNGQNVKALLHFIITASLLALSDIFEWPMEPVLGLAGFGFYCYSIYNAFLSSHRLHKGEDLVKEDERLKAYLQEHTNVFGALLITVGMLAAARIYLPTHFPYLWPFFLMGTGICLWRVYQIRRRQPESEMRFRPQPPSVVPSPYDRPTNELVGIESRFDR